MLDLLTLHKFAAERGEGLLPELLELLVRRSSPSDPSAEAHAGASNVTPLNPPRDPLPPIGGNENERAA